MCKKRVQTRKEDSLKRKQMDLGMAKKYENKLLTYNAVHFYLYYNSGLATALTIGSFLSLVHTSLLHLFGCGVDGLGGGNSSLCILWKYLINTATWWNNSSESVPGASPNFSCSEMR